MTDEISRDHGKQDDAHLRRVSGAHEITPRFRSIRRCNTGEPVTGLSPLDYPTYAICLVCDKKITCRHYMASWVHLE